MMSSTLPLRILLVDSDQVAREQAVVVIEDQSDLTVVGEATSGEDAIALVNSIGPEVVVMEAELGTMTGPDVVAMIAERWPSIAIVGLASFDHGSDPLEMIRAGALATVDKKQLRGLPAAIRRAFDLVAEMNQYRP